MAIDPKILDDLAQKLAGVVPAGVSQVRDDLQKNLRAILQSVLGHLDLVTREEFDVQNKVLERPRGSLGPADGDVHISIAVQIARRCTVAIARKDRLQGEGWRERP